MEASSIVVWVALSIPLGLMVLAVVCLSVMGKTTGLDQPRRHRRGDKVRRSFFRSLCASPNVPDDLELQRCPRPPHNSFGSSATLVYPDPVFLRGPLCPVVQSLTDDEYGEHEPQQLQANRSLALRCLEGRFSFEDQGLRAPSPLCPVRDEAILLARYLPPRWDAEALPPESVASSTWNPVQYTASIGSSFQPPASTFSMDMEQDVEGDRFSNETNTDLWPDF